MITSWFQLVWWICHHIIDIDDFVKVFYVVIARHFAFSKIINAFEYMCFQS